MYELLTISKALADPTRLRILKMLLMKPLCVCEVMHVLKMAQSTTSKHLQILLKAGLVEAGSGGIWTVYHIAKKPNDQMMAQILNLIENAQETKQMKEDAAAAKRVDRHRLCFKKTKKI